MAAAGALEMTGGQRVELERLARSHTAPARDVRQAKALLWAADVGSNAEVARRCASTPKSVRRRFAAKGTAAAGRTRAGVAAQLCWVTMLWKRSCMTRAHGARRRLCVLVDEVDGGPVRCRQGHGGPDIPGTADPAVEGGDIQAVTGPSFESKLRDVVGLYVNPPAAAAVFCFDEKIRVRALDRTQPSRPMVPGRAGTMTHDYKRNGTCSPG